MSSVCEILTTPATCVPAGGKCFKPFSENIFKTKQFCLRKSRSAEQLAPTAHEAPCCRCLDLVFSSVAPHLLSTLPPLPPPYPAPSVPTPHSPWASSSAHPVAQLQILRYSWHAINEQQTCTDRRAANLLLCRSQKILHDWHLPGE